MARLKLVADPERTELEVASKRHQRALLRGVANPRTGKLERKAPTTAATYGYAAASFLEWLTAEGRSTIVQDLTRDDVEEWLDHLQATKAEWTVNNYARGLRSLFAWLEEEGEIDRSPMARVATPAITPKTKDREYVPEKDVEELWAWIRVASRSKAERAATMLYERRDAAILAMFLTSGGRLDELTKLTVNSVDMDESKAVTTGKGGKERILRWDERTASALRAYLRVRNAYPGTDKTDALWIGRGAKPMTRSGLYQVVVDRSTELGLPGLHPHRFRHTFADQWLSKGGSEHGLATAMGWKDARMVAVYGASGKQRRAQAEGEALGIW